MQQGSLSAGLRGSTSLDDRRLSFLRMVSHELRTPLNSIIGFSEIIGRELHGPILEPRYKSHAEAIRESGLKLLKLVNQVLEIARLNTGSELNLQADSPVAAVKWALAACEPEATAHNVAFDVEIDPTTPHVLADPKGLRTILVNLIQNAVAFSPESSTVRIVVRSSDQVVLFKIVNAGEGVPESDLPRLMQPFEQGENALTRRTCGAGLGLPIVVLLCQDMGGVLRLRSSPGQGMTAVVGLPAAGTAPASADFELASTMAVDRPRLSS